VSGNVAKLQLNLAYILSPSVGFAATTDVPCTSTSKKQLIVTSVKMLSTIVRTSFRMNARSLSSAARINGSVKWFNGQKGYGFIVNPETQEEVFAHQSQIQSDGFRTLVGELSKSS